MIIILKDEQSKQNNCDERRNGDSEEDLETSSDKKEGVFPDFQLRLR